MIEYYFLPAIIKSGRIYPLPDFFETILSDDDHLVKGFIQVTEPDEIYPLGLS